MTKTFDPSRRRLFRQGAAIGVVATCLALKAEAFAQAAKVSKTAAKYQDQPQGAQQCDGCTLFIPGKTPPADGTCKIVEGSIGPKGWCMFFSAKS